MDAVHSSLTTRVVYKQEGNAASKRGQLLPLEFFSAMIVCPLSFSSSSSSLSASSLGRSCFRGHASRFHFSGHSFGERRPELVSSRKRETKRRRRQHLD